MTDSEMVRFLMARSADYERDAKAATDKPALATAYYTIAMELREAARQVSA